MYGLNKSADRPTVALPVVKTANKINLIIPLVYSYCSKKN